MRPYRLTKPYLTGLDVFSILQSYSVSDMYKCSHGTFSRWDNYINHICVVHDNGVNVNKFKCEECDRIFFKSSNFKVHCENRKPKQCAKCQVVCCTKKQLQKHNRKIHPYFKCEKCERYFSRKIHLEAHEQRNTNTRSAQKHTQIMT